MGLASGISVILIVLEAFIMVVSYGYFTQCSSEFPNGNCWDPRNYGRSGVGSLELYIGATIRIFGIAVLLSGNVVRQIGKMRDTSPDTTR